MRIIPRLNPPLRFYVASRLENAAEVKRLVTRFEAWGWVCAYDWTTHCNVRGADEGVAERVRETCGAEVRGVITADLVVFLLPGGRGMHTEIGLAIASRRRPRMILASLDETLLGFTEDTSVFYHHSRAEHVIGGVDEVLTHLEGEGDE